MTECLKTTALAAKLCGVTPGTMRLWRVKGTGPVYTKINGKCYYKPSVINTFINDRTFRNTSQSGAA